MVDREMGNHMDERESQRIRIQPTTALLYETVPVMEHQVPRLLLLSPTGRRPQCHHFHPLIIPQFLHFLLFISLSFLVLTPLTNNSTQKHTQSLESAEEMASNGLELEITELRLGLPGSGHTSTSKHDNKRVFSEMNANEGGDERSSTDCDGADRRRSKKNQVVGWPPVCSYRRRSNGNDKDLSETSKMYVKVSMDGAPYLRKVDLGMHKGYSDLGMAMENLFGCAIGSSDYVPIYEDRDGDWMLVGDVPWKMFVESCKRLRIMKRSEAKGFEIQVPKTRSSSSPRKL